MLGLCHLSLFILVLGSCDAQHNNQAIPSAVSCLVYPPGHVALAKLPTLVSLQPTSTTHWSTKFHITDQNNKLLTCLHLATSGGQVKVQLYPRQCGEGNFVGSTWSKELFRPDSWTHITLTLTTNLEVALLDNHSSTSVSSPLDYDPSDEIFVYAQNSTVSVSFACKDGCHFQEHNSVSQPVKMTKKSKTFTVFIYPLLVKDIISFQAVVSKGWGGSTLGEVTSLNKEHIVVGKWNQFKIEINKNNYKVFLGTATTPILTKSFVRIEIKYINVFITGSAYWNLKCKPDNVSTQTTSVTRKTTSTTTVTVWSSTNEDETSRTVSTITSLSTASSGVNKSIILHYILILTIAGVIGSFIDLILTFRLIHV